MSKNLHYALSNVIHCMFKGYMFGVCLGCNLRKQLLPTCLSAVITGFSVGPGWISRKPISRRSLQLLCSCWRPVCSGWSTTTRYLLLTRESSSLCWLWQWKGVSLGSGLLFFLNSLFAGFERGVKCSFNFVFDGQFFTTCKKNWTVLQPLTFT